MKKNLKESVDRIKSNLDAIQDEIQKISKMKLYADELEEVHETYGFSAELMTEIFFPDYYKKHYRTIPIR